MTEPLEGVKERVCESCGEHFAYLAELGECWCFAIDLSWEDLEQLRAKGTDCLCPECLRAFAAKTASG